MLQLENISLIKQNKTILKSINLTVEDGEFIVITGPNGGGKSSLAKIIMGIETPTTGNIIYNGKDITQKTITERANLGIGLSFQQPIKFKGITVSDLINISLGRNAECKENCKYLSQVGLCPKDYINREINSSLSGGELKRIEIATIIARNTRLSIFDEPEAGIDLWSFSKLINVFNQNYKNTPNSVIIISHQEKILEIADRIIIIENGQIKEQGTKEQILPNLICTNKKCKALNE